jgi:hypothetical protein
LATSRGESLMIAQTSQSAAIAQINQSKLARQSYARSCQRHVAGSYLNQGSKFIVS